MYEYHLCHTPGGEAAQALTLRLLLEADRGSGSRWHIYVTQLPTAVLRLADFSREAAEALQVRVTLSEQLFAFVNSSFNIVPCTVTDADGGTCIPLPV